MKTMKLWRNILVMTAVMLSLASCSSNDNDQEKPFTVCPEELVKFFACEMNSKTRGTAIDTLFTEDETSSGSTSALAKSALRSRMNNFSRN